ncbi:proteasome assembly chaperone family protein [Microbacterium gorillae]|uniref:proteasome assembly chaperone family protein n=1 Tax=Microbacterium gorillae TaxID=1231063 RepID=UPI00058CE616|nr:PAC2 family protein [Microbacterium gorillae]
MPLSDDIYERAVPLRPVPRGLPLLVLLTGFTDAGGVVAGLIERFRENESREVLGMFDNDVLLDYRARRPIITFDRDHLTDFRPARLELTLEHDLLGQPFLLLSGYEPDFAWEAFAEVVLDLADEYAVTGMTWLHAIGMPVPHTRPLGVTVSGNRSDFIEAQSVWQPHTQVPATAGHLLEYRFVQEEVPVAGLVLLVPHYLAETEYPGAMEIALEKMTAATGLVFPEDGLADSDREFRERVDEQVAGNEDLQRMLSGLEQRYDAYSAGRSTDEGETLLGGAPLPSADEIAAELERFLATRPRPDEDAS